MITHDVQDFDAWKPHFDAGAAAREGAGIRVHAIYRGADNPNRITMHSEADSAEAFQSFFSNPELGKTMASAGVLSRPEVTLLHKI
ncbi:hypothetical protein GCM10023184_34710 [Flaviaesturariibacter amylovorans]|uniref:Cyclase n=2 Tax=Flaviaesturariibacter amylovorans TaxID=1084520 RepID=A0ABP8HER1_9BACT